MGLASLQVPFKTLKLEIDDVVQLPPDEWREPEAALGVLAIDPQVKRVRVWYASVTTLCPTTTPKEWRNFEVMEDKLCQGAPCRNYKHLWIPRGSSIASSRPLTNIPPDSWARPAVFFILPASSHFHLRDLGKLIRIVKETPEYTLPYWFRIRRILGREPNPKAGAMYYRYWTKAIQSPPGNCPEVPTRLKLEIPIKEMSDGMALTFYLQDEENGWWSRRITEMDLAQPQLNRQARGFWRIEIRDNDACQRGSRCPHFEVMLVPPDLPVYSDDSPTGLSGQGGQVGKDLRLWGFPWPSSRYIKTDVNSHFHYIRSHPYLPGDMLWYYKNNN